MPDITKKEKRAREGLLSKCYTYLDDNFHKFNETNKIRVALELVKRDMATKVEHSGKVDGTIDKIVIDIVNPHKEGKVADDRDESNSDI